MAVTRAKVSEAVMEALVGHDPDSPDGFDAVIEAVLALLDDESHDVLWEGETTGPSTATWSRIPSMVALTVPSDTRVAVIKVGP